MAAGPGLSRMLHSSEFIALCDLLGDHHHNIRVFGDDNDRAAAPQRWVFQRGFFKYSRNRSRTSFVGANVRVKLMKTDSRSTDRRPMNKLILILPMLAVSGFSQPAAPDQNNPLSSWLRNAYTGNRNNIVRTAEKMPEENYGMRPGAQPEVRTFAQQVSHVANYNFLWCSQAKGEKNPNPG